MQIQSPHLRLNRFGITGREALHVNKHPRRSFCANLRTATTLELWMCRLAHPRCSKSKRRGAVWIGTFNFLCCVFLVVPGGMDWLSEWGLESKKHGFRCRECQSLTGRPFNTLFNSCFFCCLCLFFFFFCKIEIIAMI